MIVSQVHGGDAIDLVDLAVTDSDDRQFVPFGVNELLISITYFTNDLGLTIFTDDDSLKPLSHDATPFLGIEHPKEFRLAVQIGLIAFHDKVAWLADQLATVLDP